MKKHLLISFLIVFFSFSLSAQLNENTNSLNENRKLIRKAVEVEAFTIDGKLHTGYLWYSDQEKLILTNSLLRGDSLFVINFSDLYQFKVIEPIPYGRRFLSGMAFSAAVTVVFAIEMNNREDVNRFYSGFVYLASANLISPGVGWLATHILPDKQTVFDYRTNGQEDDFLLTTNYLEKKRISSIQPEDDEILNTRIVSNEKMLASIESPSTVLHPLASRNIHLMFGMSLAFSDLSKQLESGLRNDTYSIYGSEQSDRVGYFAKIQANASPNIRPYASFVFKETGYGSGKFDALGGDFFKSDYSLFYGHIGADYILNPVNNMLLSPFEFSLGGGLSYANLKYGYSPYTNAVADKYTEKTYHALGINLSGNVDYYFSRYFSLNVSLSIDILEPIEFDDLLYTTHDNIPVTLEAGVYQTSGIHLGFGGKIHF